MCGQSGSEMKACIAGDRIATAQRSTRAVVCQVKTPPDLLILAFQFFDVSEQLLLTRQAGEVKANHLVGSQRRLLAGPQADQHAGNDRTVRLNLDAVL